MCCVPLGSRSWGCRTTWASKRCAALQRSRRGAPWRPACLPACLPAGPTPRLFSPVTLRSPQVAMGCYAHQTIGPASQVEAPSTFQARGHSRRGLAVPTGTAVSLVVVGNERREETASSARISSVAALFRTCGVCPPGYPRCWRPLPPAFHPPPAQMAAALVTGSGVAWLLFCPIWGSLPFRCAACLPACLACALPCRCWRGAAAAPAAQPAACALLPAAPDTHPPWLLCPFDSCLLPQHCFPQQAALAIVLLLYSSALCENNAATQLAYSSLALGLSRRVALALDSLAAAPLWQRWTAAYTAGRSCSAAVLAAPPRAREAVRAACVHAAEATVAAAEARSIHAAAPSLKHGAALCMRYQPLRWGLILGGPLGQPAAPAPWPRALAEGSAACPPSLPRTPLCPQPPPAGLLAARAGRLDLGATRARAAIPGVACAAGQPPRAAPAVPG